MEFKQLPGWRSKATSHDDALSPLQGAGGGEGPALLTNPRPVLSILLRAVSADVTVDWDVAIPQLSAHLLGSDFTPRARPLPEGH